MNIPHQKWFEALKTRQTRRKYKEKNVEPKKLTSLKNMAQKLNNHYSGCRIMIQEKGFDKVKKNFIGSFGLTSGAKSYAILLGKTDQPNFQIESGMAGESLILEATSLNIDTCWLGGFFEPEKINQKIDCQAKENILAITPLGYARNKSSLTEKIMSKILKSKDRKPLPELCLGSSLKKATPWMKEAFKAARLAPSTANLQPWRFKVKEEKIILLSTENKKRHGVSPYLDCGIALLHLIIGANKAGINVEIKFLEKPEVAEISPK